MRKRSLIISLVLLLLVGGGGVVFNLYLRAQEPPPFSEVDDFLIHPPESSGWLAGFPKYQSAEHVISVPRLEWLRKLGIHSSKELRQKDYWFTPAAAPDSSWVVVSVYRDDRRIESVSVNGLPADAVSFSRSLGEKFPRLRRVIKTI